jgi:hypothetical protein
MLHETRLWRVEAKLQRDQVKTRTPQSRKRWLNSESWVVPTSRHVRSLRSRERPSSLTPFILAVVKTTHMSSPACMLTHSFMTQAPSVSRLGSRGAAMSLAEDKRVESTLHAAVGGGRPSGMISQNTGRSQEQPGDEHQAPTSGCPWAWRSVS